MKKPSFDDADGRRLSVLVVEDEEDVRQSAVFALEEFGYEALQARDGREGLALLEARPDIDLLFTDVRMPGDIDGVELAFTVRSRWPAVAIIIVSGFLDLRGSRLPAGAAFLPKPYRFAALKALIEQQLARRPHAGQP
ncbi:response regulator [Rhizorhabdus dicambivorans]|uniref:response regulator n=1 Tax=Rhizorhabdus dicambivorans TaxID=1850238 RepID=UPI00082F570C|nr:response regulator [Rhizorhabdus dicambivorans]